MKIRVTVAEQGFKPIFLCCQNSPCNSSPCLNRAKHPPSAVTPGKKVPPVRNSQGWEAETPEWVSVVSQGMSLHGHEGLQGAAQAHSQLEHPHLP